MLEDRLNTQFTYGQTKRKYFTSIGSYDNWVIKNKTDLTLYKKESFKIELLLGGEYKESDFYENTKLSYEKESVSGGLNLLERENWSFKPNLKFTQYDYSPPPDSTSSQKSYKLEFDLKKYIGSTDTAVGANYYYQWKDYKYKADIQQWALNLSFELKF